MFEGLETEGDEEEELKQMVKGYQSRGGRLWSKDEARGGEEGGREEDSERESSDVVRGAVWEDDGWNGYLTFIIYSRRCRSAYAIDHAPKNAGGACKISS